MFFWLEAFLHRISYRVIRMLSEIGSYAILMFDVIRIICTSRPRWNLIIEQLHEIGVLSLPLVSLTGLATGMVLAAQAFFQLSDKGLTGTTGVMVAKSMLVEIGPVLTSFMITGRVGASISAELGSMKVTEQIDAMATMDVNPVEYLVVPRCTAMAIMVPILAIFSSTSGILGAWFISVNLYGMASQTFWDPIPAYVNWFDIFANISKSWVFGILIVSIACYQGMSVSGGARGVGKSTTASVVTCYICILVANFMMTVGLNASYWYIFGFS